jgi:hypothetical protein
MRVSVCQLARVRVGVPGGRAGWAWGGATPSVCERAGAFFPLQMALPISATESRKKKKAEKDSLFSTSGRGGGRVSLLSQLAMPESTPFPFPPVSRP